MEPSAMRLHHPIRCARTLAFAAAFAVSSMSAFAQNGQSLFSVSLQRAAADAAGQPQTETARRLSIDEAVNLALEQNLGIRIQRLDPQIQDTGVQLARSFWAPNLTSNLARNTLTQQPTSSLSGSATNILSGTATTALGLGQTLPWGGAYTATWNNQRYTTTSLFQSFSPQIGSNVNLQYTQPLLRNFQIDQLRQQ